MSEVDFLEIRDDMGEAARNMANRKPSLPPWTELMREIAELLVTLRAKKIFDDAAEAIAYVSEIVSVPDETLRHILKGDTLRHGECMTVAECICQKYEIEDSSLPNVFGAPEMLDKIRSVYIIVSDAYDSFVVRDLGGKMPRRYKGFIVDDVGLKDKRDDFGPLVRP